MSNLSVLEKIEKRIKIKSGPQPEVVLSLLDWRLIEDMILELSSPQLIKSIRKAREDYVLGKGVQYKPRV